MPKVLLALRVQEHHWVDLLALLYPWGQNCKAVVAACPWTLGRLLVLAVDFRQQVQPTPKAPDFRLVSQERKLDLWTD